MRLALKEAMQDILAGWREDLPPAWRSFATTDPDFGAIDPELSLEPWEPVFPARRGRVFPGAPKGAHMLHAFDGLAPADVRCVIVGQDPYPTPGHAVGLSFSVAPDVRPLPRSLENIFTEYRDDLGFPTPATGDLSPWAERGVMLLNRVLTVRPGTPASHRGKGWEAVTECAIRALVARQQPLVAVLWGRDASTLKPWLEGEDCVSIESPHPSPLSASRGFFGSRPFSRANELLEKLGADPIDWRLP